MDFDSSSPTAWSRGQRPLGSNEAVAGEELEPFGKRIRIQDSFNNTDSDGINRHRFSFGDEDSLSSDSEDDVMTLFPVHMASDLQDVFAPCHLDVLLPQQSWLERGVLERVNYYLVQCMPYAVLTDLSGQIRCAIDAFCGAAIPREDPLDEEMDSTMSMSASVLVLINVLGNNRGALYIHTDPNRSTAGQTEAQIEAAVTRNNVIGITQVARFFNVDKRSLGRSLKWALGCPSSGSSSKETFLFHNNHINYAQAKQKLLYFGNQA